MILNFGKYKGQEMEHIYPSDPGYIEFLAREAFTPPVRKAAQKLIDDQAEKDEVIKKLLFTFLEKQIRTNRYGIFKKYPYATITVKLDYACIELCTHDIHTTNGFKPAFWEEEWDMVHLASCYHEGDESIFARKGVAAKPDEKMWYACPDNSGIGPLNSEPLTLLDAITLLDLNKVFQKKEK